jgi:hypothetical protein
MCLTSETHKGKMEALSGFKLKADRFDPNSNKAGPDRYPKISVEAGYLD